MVRDNIDTDQIISAQYLNLVPTIPDEYKKLGSFALAGLPDSLYPVRYIKAGQLDSEYPIVVGGRNFGCGSSREHAPIALGSAGCNVVLAESFARIFFRNSVATGELYPCECADRLCDDLKTGDVVTVDLDKATVTVQSHRQGPFLQAAGRCASGGGCRRIVQLRPQNRHDAGLSRLSASQLPRRTQGLDSPRQKIAFEISQYFRQGVRRRDWRKGRAGLEDGLHLREVIRVVRAQINRAARNQRGTRQLGKRSLISRCL